MRSFNLIGLILILGSIQAAELQVGETQHLTGELEQPAYFPSYSADGQSVLFTQAGFQGLWIMERGSGKTQQLSSNSGAGYEPLALNDGSIVYREDQYVQGRKLTSLMRHLNGASSPIARDQRFVSQVRAIDQAVSFYSAAELNVFDLQNETLRETGSTTPTVVNDKLSIVLQEGETTTTLAPLGEGQYVWVEMSPSADRILFTKVGVGSFISDLKGKIVAELGTARAPKWSPDGQFVVYMVDQDNGSQYTASEIWISDALGEQKWQVTDTPQRIELYPQWSPTGEHVVYHTTQGEFYETALEIRK